MDLRELSAELKKQKVVLLTKKSTNTISQNFEAICNRCKNHFTDSGLNLSRKIRQKKIACQYCNGSKISLTAAQELAKSKNGKIISEVKKLKDNGLRFLWKCHIKDHSPWEASYANIKGNKSKKGTWCPSCAGRNKTFKDLKDLAKKKGYNCLSKKYITSNTKYEFKCKIGHYFKTTHNKLQGSSGCPECTRGVSERIVREYFEKCFKKEFPNVRNLEWLKSPTGHKLELDGYCQELKIAFEHHGMQHYSEKAFMTLGKSEFKKRQEYDSIKRVQCIKNGIRLIEIPQVFMKTKIEDLPSFLETEFDRYDLSPKIKPSEVKIDWSKIYNSSKLIELKLECRAKSLSCLEKAYMGAKATHRFKCLKCKFCFKTAPQSLAGCPKCAGNLKKTITEISKILKEKGLKLLSTEYTNNKTPLQIKCLKCSSIFSKSLDKIRSSRGCNKCSKLLKVSHNKLTLAEVKKICKKNNILILDKEYKNGNTPMLCKCTVCGSEGMKKLSNIRYGKSCAECGKNKISKSRKKPITLLISEARTANLKLLNPKAYLEKGESKLQYQCLLCKKNLLMSSLNVRKGQGCKSCKIHIHYQKNKKSKKELILEAKRQNLQIINPDEFIKTSQYLKYKCLNCGAIAQKKVSNVTTGAAGCRSCMSKKKVS